MLPLEGFKPLFTTQLSKQNFDICNYNASTIKYIGSKKKIIPYIEKIISNYSDIKTVLDGFSGSGRVSQFFSCYNLKVTSNDLATYSNILSTCFFKRKKKHRK